MEWIRDPLKSIFMNVHPELFLTQSCKKHSESKLMLDKYILLKINRQQCNWPENVDQEKCSCGQKPRPPTTQAPSQGGWHPPPTQSPTQPPSGGWNPPQKPSGGGGGGSNSCSAEGFFPNEQNCRKFIRCVDNGAGGLQQYNFDCPPGTIYDTDLPPGTCNHPTALSPSNKCYPGSNNNQGPPQTQRPPTTQTPGQRPPETQRPPQRPTQRPTNAPAVPPPSGPDCNNQTECTSEGFHPNPEDCKKFFRCVDFGKGSLTKFDFDCGPGTVYDPDLTTCNHPWAVNPNSKCYKPLENGGGGSGGGGSGCQQQNSTGCGGGGNQPDGSQPQPPKPTTEAPKPKPTQRPPSASKTCTEEGFFPIENDCTRFYRFEI
jgi:hypothetical protein